MPNCWINEQKINKHYSIYSFWRKTHKFNHFLFKNSLAYNKYYSLENKKTMSKEKEKNCSKCDKTLRVTYHKTCCCGRKFCYSCILSYFEENLKISGFPIKCPILSCESFLGFDLVQEALKPEDFDNLMKDLRLCSGCMNYKPKHSMAKTGDCAHNKCE